MKRAALCLAIVGLASCAHTPRESDALVITDKCAPTHIAMCAGAECVCLKAADDSDDEVDR